MNVTKLAWRNVWRNKRRSGVTIVAMIIALFAMVMYSGFVNGYSIDMKKSAYDVEMGNVQMFQKGYLDKPSLYTQMKDGEAIVKKIESLGAGYHASARVIGNGLVAAGNNSSGVQFRGLVPEEDKPVSRVYERIIKGKWLSSKDMHGVVIGKQLARTLGVKTGDELVFLGQGADGSTANDLFKVRGIVANAGMEVDRSVVFMNKDMLEDFMVLDGGVHQVMVRTNDDVPDEKVAAQIKKAFPKYEVRTWREMVPELAQMIEYMSGAVFFMFFIVYIAIGIVVLNAMLMAVFERIREFGVLKAIGMGPLGVFRIILAETVVMLLAGIAGAAVLSLPTGWYLSTHGLDLSAKMESMSLAGVGINPVMLAVFDVNTVLSPVLVLVTVVFIAVLYPAGKAALLQPVKAIHHQ